MKMKYFPIIILVVLMGLMGCTPAAQVAAPPVLQPTQPLPLVVTAEQNDTNVKLVEKISSLETQVAMMSQATSTPVPNPIASPTPVPTVVSTTAVTQSPSPAAVSYGPPVVQITPIATLAYRQSYYYPQYYQNYYPQSYSNYYPYNYYSNVNAPCNRAGFIADVTIRDGAQMAPGTKFTKTWALRNDGTCTWTTDYSLVYDHGSGMGGDRSIKLPVAVAPGAQINLSVNLEAPANAGYYQDFWMLQDASGARFGIGANATTAFWVKIWSGTPTNYYSAPYYYQNQYYYPTPYYYGNSTYPQGYDPNGYWGYNHW